MASAMPCCIWRFCSWHSLSLCQRGWNHTSLLMKLPPGSTISGHPRAKSVSKSKALKKITICIFLFSQKYIQEDQAKSSNGSTHSSCCNPNRKVTISCPFPSRRNSCTHNESLFWQWWVSEVGGGPGSRISDTTYKWAETETSWK